MKKRIITALIIVLIIVSIYPVLNNLATNERGYNAFGGEELIIISGLIVAVKVLFDDTGKKRRAAHPKASRPTTESEQSNNHFDA